MALEDITAGHTIANLNIANPGISDMAGQAPQHFQNLKKSLVYTFPAISATVSSNAQELNLAHCGGTISGTVMIKGNLEIMSSLTVSATAIFKTGVTVTKELAVQGTTTLQSTTVNGVVTANGGIQSQASSSFAYIYVSELGGPGVVPAGAVMHFARSTPPTGWLECNGAAVNRETYSTLFEAIGTSFGVGDGTTTFQLPDLRGKFVRGWDHSRGVDTGRTFASDQADAQQDFWYVWHSYAYNTGGIIGDAISSSIVTSPALANSFPYATNYNYVRFNVEPSSSIRVADEVRPVNVALLPCIKY